jgi:branched-chain amino acid transport system ATP-binding protein
MKLLGIQNVHAAYFKKEVLRGVSLSAGEGELVAIIGPNGSGKSTLLKVAAGFLKPSHGSVELDGQNITPLPTHDRIHLGLAYFMQGGRVFPNLTVRENLDMASVLIPVTQREESISLAQSVFPKLRHLFKKRAGLLSGGEQQLLALAMVVVRRPRVLLLDEPTAGLAPLLAQGMLKRVQELNQAWQVTILLVEQNIREAISIARRAVVLVNGEIMLETERPAEEITAERLEQFFWSTGKSANERARLERPRSL